MNAMVELLLVFDEEFWYALHFNIKRRILLSKLGWNYRKYMHVSLSFDSSQIVSQSQSLDC